MDLSRRFRLVAFAGAWLVAALELAVQILVYTGYRPEDGYGGMGGLFFVVLLVYFVLTEGDRGSDKRTAFGRHPVAHLVGGGLFALGIAHPTWFYVSLPVPAGGLALVAGLVVYPTTRVELLDAATEARRRLGRSVDR